MLRLFVAIRPPAEIRAQLLDLMGGIGGARWQDDDQLHLTLRFIGAVDRHIARDVDAALSGIHHPAFQVALDGIGLFDRRGRPETVWAGISPQAPVRALHNKVDQAMARVGLPPDHRAFHPHITLARLDRGSGPVGDFMAREGGLSSAPFDVDHVALIESNLTPEGARYAELERYRLA